MFQALYTPLVANAEYDFDYMKMKKNLAQKSLSVSFI